MKINRQIQRQESTERRSTEKRAKLNPMEKSNSTLSRSNTAKQKKKRISAASGFAFKTEQ